MTRFILAAGVAALAITAPVGAKPGGGGGGGSHGDGNGGQSAKAQQHGGGGKAEGRRNGGGAGFRVEGRGNGGGGRFKAANVERHGGGQRFANFDRGGHGGGNGHAFKAERQAFKTDRHNKRFAGIDRGNRHDIVRARDLRGDNRFDNRIGDRFASRGLIDGCPPGLAKKNNGCMPPGQLKSSLLGRALPLGYRNGIVPLGLRNLYGDTPDYYYRYGDGYMYQVNRRTSLIESLLPLLGGGYSAGQMFPSNYASNYMPAYYQPFYQDSPYNDYQYANGYIYDVDPMSGLIQNVIPAYDSGYGIGQMIPVGYGYNNVPYQYRDMYYDTSDSYYRYAPGAIYQVDRQSNLITALASLLGGGMAVGQPLPMGYSAYNVPLAYRDQYYDTSDSYYRYNNGNIYQVDPRTQLITAIVQAIV